MLDLWQIIIFDCLVTDLPESLLETQVHEPDCLNSHSHCLLAMNCTEDMLVLPRSVFVRVSADLPLYCRSLQLAEGGPWISDSSWRTQVENQSCICHLLFLCHEGSFILQDFYYLAASKCPLNSFTSTKLLPLI